MSLYFPLQRSRKRSRSVSIESNSVESESHDSVNQAPTDYFPASKLFEYQWPLGDEKAEHYMLQEHVKEYLDIRGIQRKYPGQWLAIEVAMHSSGWRSEIVIVTTSSLSLGCL